MGNVVEDIAGDAGDWQRVRAIARASGCTTRVLRGVAVIDRDDAVVVTPDRHHR